MVKYLDANVDFLNKQTKFFNYSLAKLLKFNDFSILFLRYFVFALQKLNISIMLTIVPFLSFTFLVLLIIGLVNPEKGLFWHKGERTKTLAGFVYGVPFIIFALLTPKPNNDTTQNNEVKQNSEIKPTTEKEVKISPKEQKTLDSIAEIEAKELEAKRIETERKEQIEKAFSSWDGSHIELTKLLKKSMNDPDSYEHVSTQYFDQKDHLIINTQYRGKNQFGAKVLGFVKAKVDLEGNVLEIIEQR